MSKPVEDDVCELVHNDELAEDTGPDLSDNRQEDKPESEHNRDNGVASLGQINPALEDGDVEAETGRKTDLPVGDSATNGSQNESMPSDESREVPISSPPVHYSTHSGETNVIREPVVVRQPNGIHVIRTRECYQPRHNVRERPLKLKHIKILKVFSIISVLLFFPLGIIAAYSAFKCEEEFHAGILRGNIDLARKYAKRSERLIIFSVLGALLVAVMVFAFVERKLMADDEEYWKHRSNAHFVPAG